MAKFVFDRNERILKKPYIQVIGKVKRVEGQFLVAEFPSPRNNGTFSQTLWISQWTKGGNGFVVGKNYKFFITLNVVDGKTFFNVRSYSETNEPFTCETTLSGTLNSIKTVGNHQILDIGGALVYNQYSEFDVTNNYIGQTGEFTVRLFKTPRFLPNGDVDISDTYKDSKGVDRQKYYTELKLIQDE